VISSRHPLLGKLAPVRIWAYLQERFPPVPYSLLVVLFYGSAAAVASSLGVDGRDQTHWAGALVVLLVFFHLRVFDEHKDAEADAQAYPDRLLTQGVVTLPLLSSLAAGAIMVEAALSVWIGTPALIAWAATFGFTLAMRAEFGVGEWLQNRMVLYAVTHNPVTGLLAVFAWACTGASWSHRFWAYIAFASFGSLAFEVGRKVRLPQEEVPGVPSYTTVLGRPRALGLLAGCYVIAAAAVLVLVGLTGIGLAAALVPAVLALALLLPPSSAPAKRVEAGASLYLLGSFGVLWWLV
jgi:4-hydroxybenzoate polyprenyltransferase